MKNCAILVVIAMLILSVCSGCTPAHVPLKQEDAMRISATKLHAAVAQEEIVADVAKSNVSTYTGGGLLPALIDLAVESHRSHTANDLLEPIRKASTGFDFRKVLDGQLQGLKRPSGILKLSDIAVSATPLNEEQRQAVLGKMTENALLELNVNYRLSSDFKALQVTCISKLWMKDLKEPASLNTFAYHTPPLSDIEVEQAAVAWSANDAALLRKSLLEATDEIARMVSLEFSQDQQVDSPTPELSMIGGKGKYSAPSYLSKKGNRYIVRMDNGTIASLSAERSLVVPKP